MNANEIKQLARDLGADLVGIASAKTLNAFPPDPRYPHPDNISPYVKSVIVIACHIPVAGLRAKHNIAVQYLDMLVLGRMDGIAYKIADHLGQEDIKLLQLRATGVLKQQAGAQHPTPGHRSGPRDVWA